MIEIQPIIVAILSAGVYSILWYSRQVIDPTQETPQFQPRKFISTLIVGTGIGIFSVIAGLPVDQMGIESQLAAYSLVIVAVEQLGKPVWRFFEKFVGEQNGSI